MRWFKLDKLKKIRVVLSLFFLIAISILFIDPWNAIPQTISNIFISLQLIPSIIKILFYVGISTIGLAIILGLTLAFGRVYCSTICPLGTFQDLIIRLRKKIKRGHFTYKKPHYFFHYFLSIAVAIFAIFGSMLLINLLEPFSNYGRILTNLIEPLLTFGNNLIASIFSSYKLYFLYNITMRQINISTLIIPILFLLVVGYMSYRHGRLFCNLLCPAGALLGIISRFSFFKIVVDKNNCNYCGACEKVCKANCIQSENQIIDFAACIGCFNCIMSCPTDAVIYKMRSSKNIAKDRSLFSKQRRIFLKEMFTPAIGVALPLVTQSDTSVKNHSGYIQNKNVPITPPGSKSIEHFSSLCTACHLCVSACPTQVLYPTFLDFGIAGILQPKMNYEASFCNYECNVCSQICPSGAIIPINIETKKMIQIGKSVFVRDDCVVVTKKKDCAACSEHCPTKAVYMVPYEGQLKIPELNNDICVGCGACEFACPTTPRKAIYVKSNSVHLQAQKPKIKKQEGIFDSSKEFPF